MNFTPILEAKKPDFNKNMKIGIGKIFFKYVIAWNSNRYNLTNLTAKFVL